jgi:hypothetical protein
MSVPVQRAAEEEEEEEEEGEEEEVPSSFRLEAEICWMIGRSSCSTCPPNVLSWH